MNGGSMKILQTFHLLLAAGFMAGTAAEGTGAEVELLPDQGVRVTTPGVSGARVAVDGSMNLSGWLEITNLAPREGVVTFKDPDGKDKPTRFYRLSDGDEWFKVEGYVDGGELFGPVAGAEVTVTPGDVRTTTDAQGRFRLEQRFGRESLPVMARVTGAGFVEAEREMGASDAGSLMVLRSGPKGGAMLPLLARGVKYQFLVGSGSRAGERYEIVFDGLRFTATGAVTGAGTFEALTDPPARIRLVFDGGAGPASEALFWSLGSATEAAFAGIPSPAGTLAGNGRVTIELPAGGGAPGRLSKVHVVIERGPIGAYSATIHLTGEASGTFTITDGSSGSGNFVYAPAGAVAQLLLNYTGEFAGDVDDFALQFTGTPSGGNTFTGTQKVGIMTGVMEGTFTYE